MAHVRQHKRATASMPRLAAIDMLPAPSDGMNECLLHDWHEDEERYDCAVIACACFIQPCKDDELVRARVAQGLTCAHHFGCTTWLWQLLGLHAL